MKTKHRFGCVGAWGTWLLVGLILAISAIVLLTGVRRDLPYDCHGDEMTFLDAAVRIASSGSLNPGWFGHPGSTVIYPLAAIFRFDHARRFGLSWRENDPALAERFAFSFWRYCLYGRLLNVAYGVLSVLLVFLLGRRLFDARVGCAGAWLFALCPLAVAYTRMVRTDSPAVFFSLLALLFILREYDDPGWGNQIAAGVSIGLAISSRFFMVALLPVLAVVDLAHLLHGQPGRRGGAWARAVGGGLAVAIAFFASSPYLFLDAAHAIESLRFEARPAHMGSDGLSWSGNALWYMTVAFPRAMTWPAFLVSLAGLFFCLRVRRLRALLPAFFAAVLIAGASLSSLHWDRWVLQAVPLMCLYAAYAADRALRHRARGAFAVAIVLLSIWPAWKTLVLSIRHSKPSTRVAARMWCRDNLPAGARIAQDMYGAVLHNTPFEVEEHFSLADYGVVSALRASPNDCAIVSSSIYDRFFREPDRHPEAVAFYTELFEKGRPAVVIAPDFFTAGPTLHIYLRAQRQP